jgi:MFS-type transporter involved in bile tolerance (Atg22 family)
MSPPVSVSAALQSIMPAPVDSRSSLTIAAVIVAIVELPLCLFGPNAARRNPPHRIRFHERLDRM